MPGPLHRCDLLRGFFHPTADRKAHGIIFVGGADNSPTQVVIPRTSFLVKETSHPSGIVQG
jgi:hypothetical protein